MIHQTRLQSTLIQTRILLERRLSALFPVTPGAVDDNQPTRAFGRCLCRAAQFHPSLQLHVLANQLSGARRRSHRQYQHHSPERMRLDRPGWSELDFSFSTWRSPPRDAGDYGNVALGRLRLGRGNLLRPAEYQPCTHGDPFDCGYINPSFTGRRLHISAIQVVDLRPRFRRVDYKCLWGHYRILLSLHCFQSGGLGIWHWQWRDVYGVGDF